jgi:hypothetical protein
MLPTVIVRTASTASMVLNRGCTGPSATTARRRSAAKAAALETTDMNAVTDVGEPW